MLIIAEDSPQYLFDVNELREEEATSFESKIDVGVLAESKLSTEAISRGFVAWWPMGHAQRADICIWKPPFRPITVQVKNAQWKKLSSQWVAHVGSARGGREKRLRRQDGREVDPYRRYKSGDFDVLAVYVPPANGFRFYHLNQISDQRHVTLRDLSTLNNWHVIEDALKA